MEQLGLTSSKSSKIKLHGFQERNSNMEIDEVCKVKLHVQPSTLYLKFWVCDIERGIALLGTDILSDETIKNGIDTATGLYSIGNVAYHTKSKI